MVIPRSIYTVLISSGLLDILNYSDQSAVVLSNNGFSLVRACVNVFIVLSNLLVRTKIWEDILFLESKFIYETRMLFALSALSFHDSY